MTLQLTNVFLELFSERASANVDKRSHFLPLQLFHSVIWGAAAPERSLEMETDFNEMLAKVESFIWITSLGKMDKKMRGFGLYLIGNNEK